jgi:hypothetical protein
MNTEIKFKPKEVSQLDLAFSTRALELLPLGGDSGKIP